MSETSVTRISEVKIDLVPWWLVLLEGLAALIIGIYLFISPAPTVVLLVSILGWYWLITGILTLVTLIMDRTNATWRALSALLGIAAGIVVIGHPFWSAAIVPGTLVIIAGVLGVCFGFISLFWALKEGWGAAAVGVISVIFGLVLIGSPVIGIVMLVYLLGALGIAGGLASIYLALKLRSG
ncbi:MAG: hypothetical protein EHM14_03505 [Methanothrix sp.]|nr:MAG: hypothetical protein EHM14_03505 [Methanothrix sp.]